MCTYKFKCIKYGLNLHPTGIQLARVQLNLKFTSSNTNSKRAITYCKTGLRINQFITSFILIWFKYKNLVSRCSDLLCLIQIDVKSFNILNLYCFLSFFDFVIGLQDGNTIRH